MKGQMSDMETSGRIKSIIECREMVEAGVWGTYDNDGFTKQLCNDH